MFQDTLKEKMDSMRNQSADDLLAAFGLQRRRAAWEMMAWTTATLTTGALLGAGIALLVAPKSGRALRQDIRSRAGTLVERIGETTDSVGREVRSALSLEDGDKAKTGYKREETSRRTT